MAQRVFWHIGLPKTGTTYLQRIIWSNADVLRRAGLIVPGTGHRQHLWAALELSDDPKVARRHPDAVGSWQRLCGEADRTPGDVLLTHEFFCGADEQQVARGVERLAPAEVHVVVTARDAAGMLTSGWQESVKNGSRGSLAELATDESRRQFGWWMWDLDLVLQRWGAVLPADRIWVVPVPGRGDPPDQHWRNFASVLGLNMSVEIPDEAVNQSLGVVQIEALRRINEQLRGFKKPADRGHWIRGYLGERHLAAQSGTRLRLDDETLADCVARSERARARVLERGHRWVGDLDRLFVPPSAAQGRLVTEVEEGDVSMALAGLAATMLQDVRDLTGKATPPPDPDGLAARTRGLLRRPRR